MDKLRETLDEFMQGRYGFDSLNKILFGVYLVFVVLNLFTHDSLFYTLGICIVVYVGFRCLSRNIEGRAKENEQFLKMTNGITKKYRLYMRMWNDRNTHVYRKCPHCNTMIRLPKVKGHHTTNCPKCHKDFDVKV